MSITLYTGRPGSGKTYLLTRETIKKLNKGHIVYANYFIQWNGYERKKWNWKLFKFEKISYPASNLRPWSDLPDLSKVENCYIVMDEANVYMDAREWERLSREFRYKLSQHRKDAIHILGTVQNVNRVDIVFRELVDFWYVCSHRLKLITRWEFDIDDDKQKKYPLSRRFYILRKSVFSRYDTLQKVSRDVQERKPYELKSRKEVWGELGTPGGTR